MINLPFIKNSKLNPGQINKMYTQLGFYLCTFYSTVKSGYSTVWSNYRIEGGFYR